MMRKMKKVISILLIIGIVLSNNCFANIVKDIENEEYHAGENITMVKSESTTEIIEYNTESSLDAENECEDDAILIEEKNNDKKASDSYEINNDGEKEKNDVDEENDEEDEDDENEYTEENVEIEEKSCEDIEKEINDIGKKRENDNVDVIEQNNEFLLDDENECEDDAILIKEEDKDINNSENNEIKYAEVEEEYDEVVEDENEEAKEKYDEEAEDENDGEEKDSEDIEKKVYNIEENEQNNNINEDKKPLDVDETNEATASNIMLEINEENTNDNIDIDLSLKTLLSSPSVVNEVVAEIDENEEMVSSPSVTNKTLFGNGGNDYIITPSWFPEDRKKRAEITKLTVKKGGDRPIGIAYSIDGDFKYYKDGTEIILYVPNINDNIILNQTFAYGYQKRGIAGDTGGYGVFEGFSNIKTIENLELIDVTQTEYMYNMFSECSSLTSLNLSSFDTSCVKDMFGMFYYCINLKNLDISMFDTSSVTDMCGMFSDCSSLTNLNLSNFDTSKVKFMCGSDYSEEYLGMFHNCSSLVNLNISNFDISNIESMYGMFSGCSNLQSLNLSGLNASKVSNMGSTFYGCDNLIELNLTNFKFGTTVFRFPSTIENIVLTNVDTSNVTSMEFMFNGCSELTNIDVSNFDTSNVTSMASMFSGCSSLTILDLSNFDTSCVTDMWGMFSGCSSLTTLDLSSFNTSNVTNTNGMFSGCSNLTTLDLSSFDTSNVTSMEFMFNGCSELTNIDVSNFDTSNVTSVESMFSGCNELASLNLSNFNTSNITSMYNMFSGCSSLVILNLSNFDVQQVTVLRGIFSGCSGLKTLQISNCKFGVYSFEREFYDEYIKIPETIQYVDLSNSVLEGDISKMFSGYSDLVSINLSGIDASQVSNMSYMFSGCSSLTTLNLSNSGINSATNMGGMFSGCSSLTILDLSNFDTSCVTDMWGMFSGCSSLTTLDLSSFNTSNVTNTNGMFSGCSNLTTLDLSSFDTSNVTSMESMFENCSRLTNINLSNFDTSNVTSMESMFNGCSGLTSIDVSNFNTSNITSMDSMFSGCSGFTSLNLSNFNTSNVTNMESMFSGCSSLIELDLSNFDTSKVQQSSYNSRLFDLSGLNSLKSIKMKNFKFGTKVFSFPSSIEFIDLTNADANNVTNMAYMFKGCSKLTSIDLSGFNTSNITFMYGMFSGCSELTNIDLSNFDTSNVTNMSSMFSGCNKLTSIDLSSFDTSNVTNMSSMFSGCNGLTSLDLSNFDTSKVVDSYNMSNMYDGCDSLKNINMTNAKFGIRGFYFPKSIENINLTNVDTSSSTNMSSMFSGCNKLTSIDLSSFDTSNVTNMSSMFSGCNGLTSLDLSNFDTSNVTSMASMFNGCSGLTNIDVSNFNTSNVTNMSYMYSGCSGVNELDLNNFVTTNVTSMSYMFTECENLESVNLCNANTPNLTYISSTFRECPKLLEIDLSKLDVSGVTDKYSVFYESENIKKLKISNSLSQIINELGLKGDWKDIGTSAIYQYDQYNGKTTLPTGGGEYERTNYHTVSFVTNGGTNIIPVIVTDGEYCYLYNCITSKEGYDFVSWYKEPDLINKINNSIKIYEDTTFYAKWKIKEYTIGFNTNGGSQVLPQTVEYNQFITKPVNPTKNGYVFVDWYTENTLENLYDFSIPVTSNFNLYAKWIDDTRTKYIVSFNSNGGTSVVNQNVPENDYVIEPTNVTKKGYILDGWYSDSLLIDLWNFTINKVTSNKTLYAKWIEKTYTISYNLGGASWIANYNPPETRLYTESVNLPTNDKLVKSGYTFGGWYENSSCTGTKLTNISSGTDSNKVLYAQWKKNLPQYTITFNSNGGSSVTSVKIDKGSKLTKPANPTKTGYTFSNWYKDSALTTLWNFSTDTVTKNATLYAKWTINKYTVTFNTNGGSKIANASIKYNAKVTKPANPTRKGYTFVNWYKDSSCKTVYDFASKVTKNTTIYAKWTPITYKIILKANGQTGSDKTISCKYDTAITLSNSDNHFTSKTHNLSSWNTKADGKGTKYAEGASIKNLSATNGAKVYLYAQWAKAKWTVKYNANGGTGTMANQSITVGTSTALTANKFKRTGYTFAGWSKTKTGKVAYKDKVKVNNLVAKNKTITLYSIWTENTYKVTYTVNGGAWKSGYKAPATRKYTKALTLPKAANITKTGYTFAGWYTDSKFKTKVTSIAAKKGNVTVYAKWTENTYKVTYDLKGGAWVSGYTAPTSRKYTKALTLPTATNITKTGYTFAGWYTDSKFKTKVTSIEAKKGNVTVYAKWAINNYTITYELNGGVWKTGYTPTTKVQYNKLLVVSAPTKKGYTFVNWYTDSTFKTAFNPKAKITKNTILYAKWKKK